MLRNHAAFGCAWTPLDACDASWSENYKIGQTHCHDIQHFLIVNASRFPPRPIAGLVAVERHEGSLLLLDLLEGGLAGWVAGRLAAWPAGRLAGWLAGWRVGWQICFQ